MNCPKCKNDFVQGRKDQIYCSRRCQSIARVNRKNKLRPRQRNHINYDITLEYYNSLLIAQNFCCAICNIPETLLKKKLSIDHCHKSGKVRGLLCHSCNVALGHFRDNKDFLVNAIEYLNITKKDTSYD